MNTQILDLAEQAKQSALDAMIKIADKEQALKVYSESYDTKFAELIVKECLDIALEVRGEPATDTHYVIGYDRACEKMISGIREHFGVEE